MSHNSYIDTQLLVAVFTAVVTLWSAFFYLNKGNLLVSSHNRNSIIINSSTPAASLNPRYLLKLSTVVVLCTALFGINMRACAGFIFFEQLSINPLGIDLFALSTVTYAALQVILCTIAIGSLTISLEYVFCLSNFFLIASVLYLSANLYSFFFSLELINVLIFLKFSSLQVSSKAISLNTATSRVVRPVAAKLVTTLFTQYWVSFFSSVLLITFIIIASFFFGTSSYLDLGVLSSAQYFETSTASSYFSSLWELLLVIGFFLKAGMAPFHNFKTEIYKGVPLLTTFVYTFVFFVTFYIYFIYLLVMCLPHILTNNHVVIVVSLSVSALYLLSNLFSAKYIKSFLALSSVLNSIILFSVILSIVV